MKINRKKKSVNVPVSITLTLGELLNSINFQNLEVLTPSDGKVYLSHSEVATEIESSIKNDTVNLEDIKLIFTPKVGFEVHEMFPGIDFLDPLYEQD
jgi:hypothetical protein